MSRTLCHHLPRQHLTPNHSRRKSAFFPSAPPLSPSFDLSPLLLYPVSRQTLGRWLQGLSCPWSIMYCRHPLADLSFGLPAGMHHSHQTHPPQQLSGSSSATVVSFIFVGRGFPSETTILLPRRTTHRLLPKVKKCQTRRSHLHMEKTVIPIPQDFDGDIPCVLKCQ